MHKTQLCSSRNKIHIIMSNILLKKSIFSQLHILPFACSLHFELYEVDGNEHYIQIFYRKSNEEILSPMNIPGCGQKCALDRFYDLYNDIIPDRDHDIECELVENS